MTTGILSYCPSPTKILHSLRQKKWSVGWCNGQPGLRFLGQKTNGIRIFFSVVRLLFSRAILRDRFRRFKIRGRTHSVTKSFSFNCAHNALKRDQNRLLVGNNMALGFVQKDVRQRTPTTIITFHPSIAIRLTYNQTVYRIPTEL
jgi:hypothetical protein